METHSKTGKGIGARHTRKEDDRYMRGRGEFVADISLAGLKDVAFLRSPLAHARLHGINVPERFRDRVFTHDDMTGVRAIRAVTGLPGFKVSEQPPLATGKVRHVGELVAMCLGETRAEAEDVAAEIDVQFEELPVIVNMLQGQRSDSPLVHEDWGDNIYLDSSFDGDLTEAKAAAAVTVTKEFRTNRQCMAPLEGKGAVAYWDSRLEQLVVYTATQMPHIVRTGLAECLGLDQA